MKYDEFKRKVEALSDKYEITKNHASVYLQHEGFVIGYVDNQSQFILSVDFKDSFPFSHKLYMLAAEYAMTPIKKRGDKKQYVIPIWTNFLGDTWYLMDDMSKTTRHKGKAMKLTQSKIDEYNKDFTFDLNTIKQEVKDD